MTSQTIPRGHHPGPQRGEVLGTELKLGAPFSFQCQGKTQGETKVLTSVVVKEGSIMLVMYSLEDLELASSFTSMALLSFGIPRDRGLLRLQSLEQSL
jgi:hypothetical protein